MFKNKLLPMSSILCSGHQFTEQEYMLKTHYILSNILLVVLTLTLGMLACVHHVGHHTFYVAVNVISLLISIVVIFVLRKLPTSYFYTLAHIVFSIFLGLILLTFKYNVTTFPTTTWFLIYIMGIYFIFDHTVVRKYMFVFIVAFLYIVLNDNELKTYLYIGNFVFTAILGYVLIYFYEYRAKELHMRLLNINHHLEERVDEEARARTEVLHQEKETLDFLAKHDYLTKIPNMFSLHQILDRKCLDTGDKFALVYIDLDKFKNINDIYGHQAGNKVLEIIANRLQKTLSSHVVARVGGDEFILLIDGYAAERDLEKKVIACIAEIEKEIVVGSTSMGLSVSMGISIFPDDHVEKEHLIKFADRAMKKSKKSPISQYTFYAEGNSILGYSKMQLELDLHTALANQEFVLYYQPQIDAQTKKIVGVEALLRWNHPSLGILAPVYFLDLAKEKGMLKDIEKFVLQEAFASVAKWHQYYDYRGRISINLSIQKLESKTFLAEVDEVLQLHQCMGEWIEFEILETEILSDVHKVQAVFEKLHQKDIHIAIDDFGTGYASLSYLLLLDINKIKIDKIFIDNLLGSPRTIAIIDAIVTIAANSNYAIVVEGVETQDQLDLLTDHQCNTIQGYYYHKPLAEAALCALLERDGVPVTIS